MIVVDDEGRAVGLVSDGDGVSRVQPQQQRPLGLVDRQIVLRAVTALVRKD